MMSSPLTRIQVLVMRDELAGTAGSAGAPVYDLLPDEARLRVTVTPSAYGEGLRAARRQEPDVILLDGVLGDPAGLVAELDEALPRTPLLVILDEGQRDRANDCNLAGARACLVRPIDPNALLRTIIQVHGKALRRRRQLEAEQHASGERIGHIVAVRGAKGGVGATFIATNLAVALRRRTKRRVALVDAHFLGGDVPAALDLTPDRSLADLIPHLDKLDDDMWSTTLAQHDSGVAVLAAPAELDRAETITAVEFQRVLEALRTRFHYIVIDSATTLDQNSLLVLDLADVVLLVCTPELAALKNATRFLQLGAQFGYPESKLRLVLNRQNTPGAIGRADIEKHLSYPTSFRIPHEGVAVLRALNRGEPLVTFERTSRAGRALERLARIVVANEGWEGEPTPRRARSKLHLPSFRLLPRRLKAAEPTQE